MNRRMEFGVASANVASVMNNIKTVEYGGLDLRPKYQRPYIWDTTFKNQLIYSVIKQYPIGNFSIRILSNEDIQNGTNTKGARTEVVDGQQRLTTIYNFVEENYEVKGRYAREIIKEISNYFGEKFDPDLEKLKRKLSNKGSISIKYSQLPKLIQGNIGAFNISVTNISNADEDMITEYFRFLQNQERLRAGEIINSMPATELEKYLLEINEKETFLESIGFTDDRREFDKIFYSIVGLLDGKISFGTTDRIVQEYVSSAKDLSNGLLMVNRIIEQINTITQCKIKFIDSSKRRFVKYLLLLMGLGLVDFSEDTIAKIKTLKLLDEKISSFSSAKADIVTNTFAGYDEKVIEEIRFIALLAKGGHSLDRVKNRMQMLAFYINNPNNTTNTSGIRPIEQL